MRRLRAHAGLDEAGDAREEVERHIGTVLAARGQPLLCTSRPAGLSDALFKGFHCFELVPLSEEQQMGFIARRLGDERARNLDPYLRDKVPRDADGRRVTANPLMLAMVTSIAELRAGIEMPTTTAALYETATDAMLQRSAKPISGPTKDLLQAVFFAAHKDKQRIISESHIAAAVQRLGLNAVGGRREMEDTLRDLVRTDQLPLVRLVQASPLLMQAFHLSIQEYYAMRALRMGGVSLESFDWNAWWSNAVLMGVQEGDAFGEGFVTALGLNSDATAATDDVQDPASNTGVKVWRSRLVTALAHEGLPGAWLPIVAEAAGAPGEYEKLKRFVGRYRDVLQREGGKAVAQLALQQPQTNVVFDMLQIAPLQRLIAWRNKPLADDPCVATFAHEGEVNAMAVSNKHIVGGAGKAVYVYDADTEELIKRFDDSSDVRSVAVFEGDESGWIAAGFDNGTIKVWDSGAFWATNRPSLANTDAC